MVLKWEYSWSNVHYRMPIRVRTVMRAIYL